MKLYQRYILSIISKPPLGSALAQKGDKISSLETAITIHKFSLSLYLEISVSKAGFVLVLTQNPASRVLADHLCLLLGLHCCILEAVSLQWWMGTSLLNKDPTYPPGDLNIGFAFLFQQKLLILVWFKILAFNFAFVECFCSLAVRGWGANQSRKEIMKWNSFISWFQS